MHLHYDKHDGRGRFAPRTLFCTCTYCTCTWNVKSATTNSNTILIISVEWGSATACCIPESLGKQPIRISPLSTLINKHGSAGISRSVTIHRLFTSNKQVHENTVTHPPSSVKFYKRTSANSWRSDLGEFLQFEIGCRWGVVVCYGLARSSMVPLFFVRRSEGPRCSLHQRRMLTVFQDDLQ